MADALRCTSRCRLGCTSDAWQDPPPSPMRRVWEDGEVQAVCDAAKKMGEASVV